MKKGIRIQTKNKQIYEKFNLLNIVDEVVVDNNKVVNNIIKKIDGIEGICLSNGLILVRKNKPIRLDIYMK